MAKPAAALGALTSAQRVRLWRRWLSVTARTRMRAFAPLLFLLALLASLVVLPGFLPGASPLLSAHDRALLREAPDPPSRRAPPPPARRRCWNVSAVRHARPPALKVPRACAAMWFADAAEASVLPSAAVVIALPAGVPSVAAVLTARAVAERVPRRLLAEVVVAAAEGALAPSDARALRRLRRTRVLRVRDAPPPPPGASAWDEAAILRDAGAASASAPAVVFLSAGALPSADWLPALLGELAEDSEKGRRASVVSFAPAGVLDARTWTLPPGARRQSGPVGHDWSLRELRFHRDVDPTSPMRSHTPLLPGDDFAVSRAFLKAIGGVGRDGRTAFGLRAWSCGGSVAEHPCAPAVALPVCGAPATDEGRRRRVARELLGAFAPFADVALGERLGRTLPRPVAPKRGCDGFGFYVRTGFPELQPSAEILLGGGQGPHAWGVLRSALGGCVTGRRTGGDDAVGVHVGACKRAATAILTERGSITVGKELTGACATVGKGGSVTLERCKVPQKESDGQMWGIEAGRRTRVFVGRREGRRCLTVEQGGEIRVRKCEGRGAQAQTWMWEHRVEFPERANEDGEDEQTVDMVKGSKDEVLSLGEAKHSSH